MALCAGLALLDSPSHPSSPYSCCYRRSAWPSPPSAVSGVARAPQVCMRGMTLDRRASTPIGTHHTQRPHRCVRGAFKGAIASACGRASPPIATERRPLSYSPSLAKTPLAHTFINFFPPQYTPQYTTHKCRGYVCFYLFTSLLCLVRAVFGLLDSWHVLHRARQAFKGWREHKWHGDAARLLVDAEG